MTVTVREELFTITEIFSAIHIVAFQTGRIYPSFIYEKYEKSLFTKFRKKENFDYEKI